MTYDEKILEELGFMQWLRDEGYHRVMPMGDGRWVGIRSLLFHWTMHIGKIGDQDSYDDRYCYRDQALAEDCLQKWADAKFEGEPTGWHRHPMTGRRRIDGDPTTEYVAG